MKTTRQRLMELANLTESPRLTNFIHSGEIKLPISLDTYGNQQGANNPAEKTFAQHFKGADRKRMLVFAAKDTIEADKLKKSMDKYGVLGIWADPTTLVVNGKGG